MTLHVARIPYLNAAPLYTTLADEPGLTLESMTPRALGQAAQAGTIDAGLMPVADFFRLEDQFERISDLGVAVHREALSVLLFSKQPRHDLTGRVICATEETSTSYLLLRLLLEERYHVQPARYLQSEQPDNCDAMLLIGDRALKQRETMAQRLPYVIDLGREWWEWTMLPFVFAVWVVRRTVAQEDKERLRRVVHQSLSQGLQRRAAIAACAASDFNQAPDRLNHYLANFIYTLGPQEMEGLSRFRALTCERALV